ncbi:MAG: putative aminohydrolase SsnA [Oligoflexia bacterium]|nr:putative aminohydrolase SsnA [Oligoflexia bacterium]
MKAKKLPTLLIKNGTIITLGPKNRVLEKHALLIEGSRIRKIAPQAAFRGRYDKVIDATGQLVMPGFINAHMHFYSTFARGLGKAKPARDFTGVLENLWWRLDKKLTLEDSYYSALVPLIDGIRKGTTTFIDHHASPGAVRGSLGMIAKAVRETGLRASLCYEVSDRDGEKVAREGIDENIEFIQSTQVATDDTDPKLRALFGVHASFTVSEDTLARVAQAAHDLRTGVHVHTAEAASDQEHCLKTHGVRVVERFKRAGILGPDTICAHCVHVDDHELDLLAETGTQVVHNPQSNMNNAVGIADVLKMTARGIRVGLGTDAMTVNMLEELRSALWAQKHRYGDPSVGFVEMLSTLPFNNAAIADRYWKLGLGELKEGHAADVILVDYHSPTPLSADNFLGHLCFGIAESQVDTTIAGGRVLMQGKKLKLRLDEERIAARSRELSAKFWLRF